jgi:hypothetical protein
VETGGSAHPGLGADPWGIGPWIGYGMRLGATKTDGQRLRLEIGAGTYGSADRGRSAGQGRARGPATVCVRVGCAGGRSRPLALCVTDPGGMRPAPRDRTAWALPAYLGGLAPLGHWDRPLCVCVGPAWRIRGIGRPIQGIGPGHDPSPFLAPIRG